MYCYYDISINVGGYIKLGIFVERFRPRSILYEYYGQVTLGYLEGEIEKTSEGAFDSIRPQCVNGVPSYVFVDSDDQTVQRTQPLSPLYQPIVIHHQRYKELVESGSYRDSIITVRVDSIIGQYAGGLNAYKMDLAESELYAAKIPLSLKEFNYPITKVIIEVVTDSEDSEDSQPSHPHGYQPVAIEGDEGYLVDPSDYTVANGNLYFYRNLDAIIFGEAAVKYRHKLRTIFGIEEEVYFTFEFDVHIYFDTIVPDTEFGPSGAYMDTSSDITRAALAQAVSYSIADYFNQYWMAVTNAKNKATRDYTFQVTVWSTLYSSLILVPMFAVAGTAAAGIAAAKAGEATAFVFSWSSFLTRTAVGVSLIPVSVVAETLEEIYLDPFIERYISEFVYKLGFGQGAADFWSMFACSFREALLGGAKAIMGIGKGGDQGSILGLKINQERQLEIQTTQNLIKEKSIEASITQDTKTDQEIAVLRTELGQLKALAARESVKAYRNLVDSGSVLGILMSIPSFLLGGSGVGFLSMALDMPGNVIDVILEDYQKERAIEDGNKNLEDIRGKRQRLKALPKFSKINIEAIASVVMGKIRLSTWQIPSMIVPQIVSDTEFATQMSEIDVLIEESEILLDELEAIDGAKDMIPNIEQNVKENPARVQVEVDISQPSTVEREFTFRIVGRPRESLEDANKGISMPEEVSIIQAKQILRRRLGYDVELILGNTLLTHQSRYRDIDVKHDTKLKIFSDITSEPLTIMPAQIAAVDISDINIDRVLDAKMTAREKWVLMSLYESISNLVHNNPAASLELLKAKDSRILANKLDMTVNYFMDVFHRNNLEVAESHFVETWKILGKDQGLDTVQLGYLEKAASSTFTNEIKFAYDHTNVDFAKDQIKTAMLFIIIEDLLKKIDPDSGKEIYKLSLSERDKMMSLLIQEFQVICSKRNYFGTFKKYYAQAVVSCNLNIITDYVKVSKIENKIRDAPIFYFPGKIDTGVDLESGSSFELLALEHISIIKELSKTGGYNNLKNYYRYTDAVTRYSDEVIDNTLTGPVSYLRGHGLDGSAFDVLGRHWVYDKTTSTWTVICLPSKNSQRFGRNANYDTSEIGRDLARHLEQSGVDILKNDISMGHLVTEVVLNGPLFSQDKAKLIDVDSLNIAVLKDLMRQADPSSITSGLSGYRYEYWHKFTSSQNAKKALFNVVNEVIYSTNYDPSSYNLDLFKTALKDIIINDILIKYIQTSTQEKFGYFFSKQEIRDLLIDLKANCKDYYAANYDNDGNIKYGLMLQGVIGTYFETQEDFLEDFDEFEVGGTFAIVHKIETKNGQKNIIHAVRKLQTTNNHFTVKLSDADIQAGWRLGACTLDSDGKYLFHKQAIIALSGKRVQGRFSFDFENNEIIDNGRYWYLDKNTWNYYENTDGKKIGIQLISITSFAYGGEGVFINSKARVTSQYLKYGDLCKYDWAESYFSDPSWTIERISAGAYRRASHLDLLYIAPYKNIEMYNKLDSLLDIVYQFSNAYDLFGALQAETIGAGGVSHSFEFAYLFNYESVLQLHKEFRTLPDGTKKYYTKKYFKEVLVSLDPDKQLDLSKISWFFIKDGKIEKANKLKLKEFYQKFLDLIRSKIKDGDTLFTEFKNKLDTSENFDTSNPNSFTKDEKKLLRELRIALNTIFGYTGFTLLQMGSMAFNQINGKFEIEFIIPKYETLVKILNEFKIRPLNTRVFGESYAYNYLDDHRYRPRLFLSILFSGQMQLVMKSTEEHKEIYSFPELDFISQIFPDYIPDVEDSYYHSEAYNLLYNTFYTSFAGRERFGQRIADAKIKLLGILFSDIVDTQININTLAGYSPFSTMSKADQKIWLELNQIYYRIAMSDGLYFPQGRISEGSLDPTATIFDMILGILNPGLEKVLVNGKTVINNKLVQEYELNLGVILSKLSKEEISQIAPTLFFTYDHLFRSEANLRNYAAMNTERFWNLVEEPIGHSVNQLQDIFKSDDLIGVEKFTIQFRRPRHSGIDNAKSGFLKARVYNSKAVDFNIHPEIKSHNIVITETDLNNPNILRSKLFSIVYYMVKYQAFIVVKSGLSSDGNFIFAAMLNKIFGVEYLKSLSKDGQWSINNIVIPSSKLSDWNKGWNKGNLWNDLNMFIPFYLFLDNNHINNANALRDLFRIRFGVDVENLIKSG